MVRIVRQGKEIARHSSFGRNSNAQNQFGRGNCVDARWCRSLGHLDHSGPSRHAGRRTDRSVADHDRRKAPACCPLSRLLPGVQLSGRPCWRVKPEHGSSSRGVQVTLNSAAIARPFRVSEMYHDRVRDQNANPTRRSVNPSGASIGSQIGELTYCGRPECEERLANVFRLFSREMAEMNTKLTRRRFNAGAGVVLTIPWSFGLIKVTCDRRAGDRSERLMTVIM